MGTARVAQTLTWSGAVVLASIPLDAAPNGDPFLAVLGAELVGFGAAVATAYGHVEWGRPAVLDRAIALARALAGRLRRKPKPKRRPARPRPSRPA